MKQNRKTFKRGITLMVGGANMAASVAGTNINKVVHGYPWVVIIAVIVLSSLISGLWMVNCRYKQVRAEDERDSLAYVVDNYKTAFGH